MDKHNIELTGVGAALKVIKHTIWLSHRGVLPLFVHVSGTVLGLAEAAGL
jgi:hypothetical protein